MGWGEVEGGSTLIVSLTVKYPGEDEEKNMKIPCKSMKTNQKP